VSLSDALVELQELTERLRRECPWDREQTTRTIVQYTVEEAYEVADAAFAGDDAKLLDEIGDLLYQCFFLSLLLDENASGDLEAATRGVTAKLIRRHPHIFGEASEPSSARAQHERWEESKRVNEGRAGIFHDVPEALPALSYAQKVQVRARAVGFEYPDLAGAVADLDDEIRELKEDFSAHELGDVLFAAVNVARKLDVDPELELRAAAKRFRSRVESAEALAAADGKDWTTLELTDQDAYYDRAKELR
jgi:XTP/dITP diphosphohydrolase/tetrapyrrole methylase family protein/MazG family protein/ATP diphosphatase